jgi:hypothetical protein
MNREEAQQRISQALADQPEHNRIIEHEQLLAVIMEVVDDHVRSLGGHLRGPSRQEKTE